MGGLCDECRWYLEDERSGPHCRPCNMGRENNWEPVVKKDVQPTFDNEAMATLLQDIQRKEFEIWQGKNSDYASRGHDGNPFANFERIAAKLQLNREKILMVYLEKHLCAIEMYIKHGTMESGEGLLGRIIDARNYLAILAGMAKQQGVI